MIINSNRTIYGLKLQMDMLLGDRWTPMPNTTLNEKFNIGLNAPQPSSYPTLKYMCLGVGGSSIIDSQTGYRFSTHRAIDAGLFEHIPFIIRPIDQDLTLEERSKYRFRIQENINGNQYYCYQKHVWQKGRCYVG